MSTWMETISYSVSCMCEETFTCDLKGDLVKRLDVVVPTWVELTKKSLAMGCSVLRLIT